MTSYVGKNSIKNLSAILQKEKAQRVLVFTGKKSYEAIKPIINNELLGFDVIFYCDFSTNPKKEEVDVAIEKIKNKYDIILAVGGGSVIDFAKAFRYYTKPIKLIAIPTTFGTGSEATQFAVIYIDGVKQSLDCETILPNYSIIDSQFALTNPKYLRACTAIDAYCQAIESFWAVKSTDQSREYAKDAILLCKDNIVEYVNSENIDADEKMALASHLAGKAINISRTTAAHALSYKITSAYGIPHGHAVSLSMKDLFLSNQKIDEKTCIDTRGVDFVQKRIIEILEFIGIVDFSKYWTELMEKMGLEQDFEKLNIKNKLELIQSVNIQRLNNNPKNLSDDLIDFWSK